MNVFDQFIIYSHVFSGFICLVLGLIIFLGQKGSTRHIYMGKIYSSSMAYIVLSAFLISFFIDFHPFLFCIAVFAGFIQYAGYRCIIRMKKPAFTILDTIISVFVLITGIFIFSYGLLIIYQSNLNAVSIISIFFGFFIVFAAYEELILIIKKDLKNPKYWLKQHISLMIGSYIAILTAFLVQNGPKLITDPTFTWLFWLGPAIIGTPISNYAVKKQLFNNNLMSSSKIRNK